MFNFQRPKNAVEHMTAHVPERTVAEIIPTVPFMRMQVSVELAVRRRTDPFVPMHAFGGRHRGRTRPGATVGAVRPAMGFNDLAHHAGIDEFTKTAIAIFAMALVAHLSGGL